MSLLRYFNPIDAYESGLIGENPSGILNNLAPYMAQVVMGKRLHLNIFSNDYDTPEGTCIRVYIYVVDLAIDYVKILAKMNEYFGAKIYDLGTARGIVC